MNTKFFLVVFSIVLFASCSNDVAVKFNDNFIEEQKNLLPRLDSIDKIIVEFDANKEMDSVEKIATFAEDEITKVIKKIENAYTPKLPAAEDYKKAFSYYFGNIRNTYSYFKYYSVEKNPKLKAEYFEKLNATIARRGEWDNYLKDAQMNYAKQNGFKIETNFMDEIRSIKR
jgi:hypothetical protein